MAVGERVSQILVGEAVGNGKGRLLGNADGYTVGPEEGLIEGDVGVYVCPTCVGRREGSTDGLCVYV
jgi:hypothetical protein